MGRRRDTIKGGLTRAPRSDARAGQPVRYDPSIEQADEDEAATIASLVEDMLKIHETTSKDYGHAVRATHAKSQNLLQGELRVLAGLPGTLAQPILQARYVSSDHASIHPTGRHAGR